MNVVAAARRPLVLITAGSPVGSPVHTSKSMAIYLLPDEFAGLDRHADRNGELHARLVERGRRLGFDDLVEKLENCNPRFGRRLDAPIDPCRKPICARCGGRNDDDALYVRIRDCIAEDPEGHRSLVFALPTSTEPLDVRFKALHRSLSRFVEGAPARDYFRYATAMLEADFTREIPYVHAPILAGVVHGRFYEMMLAWRTETGGQVKVQKPRDAVGLAKYHLKRFRHRPHADASDEDLDALLRLVKRRFTWQINIGEWSGASTVIDATTGMAPTSSAAAPSESFPPTSRVSMAGHALEVVRALLLPDQLEAGTRLLDDVLALFGEPGGEPSR